MLVLLAYDVSNPKRLSRVAKVCEGYGVRVQYSIFECRLEPDVFENLWTDLLEEIDEDEDRLVAYRLDAKAAARTRTAGTMVCSSEVICYLI